MIENLFIHCTATKEGHDYTKTEIQSWFRARGWKHDGYHDIIHLDGLVENLQPYDHDNILQGHEIANGAKGYNTKSLHVSYVGGVHVNDVRRPKDTRTDYQKESLAIYCKMVTLRYPFIKILGHNQVSKKACPSFDVPEWLSSQCIVEPINISYQRFTEAKYSIESLIKTLSRDEDLFDLNPYE